MAALIFWGLRFLVLLRALFGLLANWRLGLTLAFALVADLFTYLWMAMPLFSVRYEIALLLIAGLVVGTVISAGTSPLTPAWLSAVICSSVLLVLRGSACISGLADGTFGLDVVAQTLPSDVAVVVG